MKVIILVQSSDKPEYVKLREAQQLTWDSIYHPNVETYYYKRNNQTEEIIGNIINTPELDDVRAWSNIYKSFVKALRLLVNKDFDYIFKTDNSTYINKEVLYNILTTKPRTNYFGGMYFPYTKNDKFVWGEGFALSKDLVKYIVQSFNTAPFLYTGCDDGVVSKILEGKAILDDTLPIYEIYHNNGEIKNNQHIYRVRKELQKNSPIAENIENLSEIIDSDIKSMYNIHNIITNGKSNNINSN